MIICFAMIYPLRLGIAGINAQQEDYNCTKTSPMARMSRSICIFQMAVRLHRKISVSSMRSASNARLSVRAGLSDYPTANAGSSLMRSTGHLKVPWLRHIRDGAAAARKSQPLAKDWLHSIAQSNVMLPIPHANQWMNLLNLWIGLSM